MSNRKYSKHSSDENLKKHLNSKYSLISFMEQSNEHWVIKDTASRYIYVNDVAFDFFKFPEHFDIEGKYDEDVPTEICRELWPDFLKNDQKTMQENKKVTSIAIHYYGKGNTGTPVPHLTNIVPLYDNNNNCIGTVGHGREIDAPELLLYMNRFNRKTIEFDTPSNIFTKRELEIAFWLQQRLSYKEIGRKLNISHRAVEDRLQTMYGKVGVNSARQFIEYCQATGLDRYIPKNFILKGVQLVD